MTEWQPFETAPKDGTALLCWSEDEGSVDLIWFEPAWGRWIDETLERYPLAPTHWMPLPAPPVSPVHREGE